MRSEEKYALEKLVSSIGGSYRDGEDPPDAYIDLAGNVIAVEVTRLIEPMLDSLELIGRPRLAGDSPASKIASEIEALFKDSVPANKTLLLTISTPIKNVRGMKSEIMSQVEDVLELGYANRLINLNGDAASITIHEADPGKSERFQSAIVNDDVSVDIGKNVACSLGERIQAKADLPKRIHDGSEYWLCILNEIWLAGSHSLQLAYSELDNNHEYDQIYVVHGHGEVQQLIKSGESNSGI